MYPRFTHATRNNSEQVVEESKSKPSFIMSHSTKVISIVWLKKTGLIYLGAQGTFKGAPQLLINRYGWIRFAHVHERVLTKNFVILIIGNSKSNHLGAKSTFTVAIKVTFRCQIRFAQLSEFRLCLSCKQINRSHTHTPTENNTPETETHAYDKYNTPNPQTNTSHKHFAKLEGGATTVRASSHARVGGRAEVSVRGRVEVRRGLCLSLIWSWRTWANVA